MGDVHKTHEQHSTKKMSTFALLITALSVLIPTCVALDAVVLVKTTDAVDIQELKNVAGVSGVYRMGKVGFFWSLDGRGQELNHIWNYTIVGKGFIDSSSQDEFLSEISGMSFVERYVGYKLKTYKFDADYINDIIKKADPKHFVKRPMKAASPKPDCERPGERPIQMAMVRIGDEKVLLNSTGEFITKVAPALHLSYKYHGRVESSNVWDYLDVIDWVDSNTWCEYAQSQYARDANWKYAGSVKGVAVGFGVEV